ncbi:MAG: DNA primase, partial [Rhodospirillales bacterium]|nr:DNA primase [Rhodospirillales bacterium]
LAPLRDAICAWAVDTDVLDSAALIDHLTRSGFQEQIDYALATAPDPLPACAKTAAMPAEAEAGWWHYYGLLNVERLRQEVAQAEAEVARNMIPATVARQLALRDALRKVESGEPDGADTVAA